MTDKLTVYKLALSHLEERTISGLSDSGSPRRVLDEFWDTTARYCLERKLWNFAYRAVQMEASTSIDPAFGYSFAFRIPDDWLRTRVLSAAPGFNPPLLQYVEESGYWYANVAPLFVQYNSFHENYGMNLGEWPELFTDFVSLRLAEKACRRITGKGDLLEGSTGLIRRAEKACRLASGMLAMNDPVGFLPTGAWVRSRRGFGSVRGDEPGGGLL